MAERFGTRASRQLQFALYAETLRLVQHDHHRRRQERPLYRSPCLRYADLCRRDAEHQQDFRRRLVAHGQRRRFAQQHQDRRTFVPRSDSGERPSQYLQRIRPRRHEEARREGRLARPDAVGLRIGRSGVETDALPDRDGPQRLGFADRRVALQVVFLPFGRPFVGSLLDVGFGQRLLLPQAPRFDRLGRPAVPAFPDHADLRVRCYGQDMEG